MLGALTIDESGAPSPSPLRLEPLPRLSPFLKWPGGKTQELAAIAAASPPLTGRFIDPFVGGGSVLLAVPAEVPALANDACRDLVELYTRGADGDSAFRRAVEGLAAAWDGLAGLENLYAELAASFMGRSPTETMAALERHRPALESVLTRVGPGLSGSSPGQVGPELLAKFNRMGRLEVRHGRHLGREDLLANIEGGVRSACYMAVRRRYNAARLAGRWNATRSADFLFLREFAYAAMFRYNARDEFNVPYGGISYNHKSLVDKAGLLFGAPMLARLAMTEFRCQDFEPFLAAADLAADDFVFVDPPYDSDFSAYDNRAFGAEDQVRLERILSRLPARVMIVIKDTPAVRALYNPDRWNVAETAKTYMWTIKSRNNRAATHLTITNYAVEDA